MNIAMSQSKEIGVYCLFLQFQGAVILNIYEVEEWRSCYIHLANQMYGT